MKEIFNEAYINCRFSCMYNVLNYFDIDPIYIIANNYYVIDNTNIAVKNIYYLPYNELFKRLGIKIRTIDLINDIRDIDIKDGEIANFKIQGRDDTLVGKKEIKSNMVILNIDKDTSNIIWRDSSNIKIFKYMTMENDDINKIYNDYINCYYDEDKEPVVNIYSKYKNFHDRLNKFCKPNILIYKLFNTYEKEIKNNSNKLKDVLYNENIELVIKFINKFIKYKKREVYKFDKLYPNKTIDKILKRQIEILEIIGYHIYKNSYKKDILINELVSLEDKFVANVMKIKIDDKFFYINKNAEDLDVKKTNKIGNYILKTINIQNNSTNGIAYKNKSKYFYKIQSINDFYSELVGYYTVYGYFPMSIINDLFIYNNSGVIIYKYDTSINNNEGLLSDVLSSNLSLKHDFLKVILKNYDNYIYNTKYPMQKFYNKRIESRLNRYLNSSWINKKIIINGKTSCQTKKIINDVKRYFKKEQMYKCVLSHGDLNTMNIGLKPFFMDFMTSGYNALEAEVALFSISILFVDLYFSPKYHKNSYKNHEKACTVIPKISCNYLIDDDIKINATIKTTKKRREIISRYLSKINYKEDEIIYFIIMRLLTIFNIDEYEDTDKYYTIFLVHYLYNELKKKTFKDVVERIDVYDSFI